MCYNTLTIDNNIRQEVSMKNRADKEVIMSHFLSGKLSPHLSASFIFTVIFTFISIFIINIQGADVSDYYNECLKFDSDGTLKMTTHDKKATSRVTYRTLGFVIKRYNAPINEPGQQYAVIRLKSCSDIAYRDDPNDSSYMYCYYYCDKDELLTAINNASSSWKNQLVNYGDYVYIDEVMTVCQNGVPLGTLTDNSSNCIKSTGEVYYTYKSIASARPWASPESLLSHYNKKVEFPVLIDPPKFSQSASLSDTIRFNNNSTLTASIGHNKYQNEMFIVNRAVPSSEPLYVRASANSALFDMTFNHYKGTGYFPVKVITPYKLIWTDSKGKSHSELKQVTRWYKVKRVFSYYTVQDFIYHYLSDLTVSNQTLPDSKYSFSINSPSITKKKLGALKNHVSISSYTQAVTTDVVTIKSKNKLRPAIPDEDYRDLAQKCVGKYTAKNDSLKIAGNVVLSGKESNIHAPAPVSFNDKISTFEKDNLFIPAKTKNGFYSSSAKAIYKLYGDETNIINISTPDVNSVTVHTPVICNIELSTNSDFNQQANYQPLEEMTNIGVPMNFIPNATGMHINEVGYMYNDYEKYIKKSQLCLPFDIYKNDALMPANRWFEFTKDDTFIIPVGTPEGCYTIMARSYAINSDDSSTIYNYCNSDYNAAAACNTATIYVAGRLYGFTSKDSSNTFTVGDRDEFGEPTSSTDVMAMELNKGIVDLSVIDVGDYNSNSSIQISMSYKLFKDGAFIPVTVYRKEKKDSFFTPCETKVAMYGSDVFPIGDTFRYKVSDDISALNGAHKFTGKLDLSGELLILPKGKYDSHLKKNEVKDLILTGDSLVVNADIKYYYNNSLTRTYTHGICNMWKLEGYDYKDRYEDGDFLIKYFKSPEKNKKNHLIVGTH